MTITNATHGRVARRARREETRLCTDERPQDVIRDSWCRRHAVGPASWRRVNDRYHIWKDPAVLGRTQQIIALEQNGHGRTADIADRPRGR
jgi:hypothetical protein